MRRNFILLFAIMALFSGKAIATGENLFSNKAFPTGNPLALDHTPVDFLRLNQTVAVGEYTMQITRLTEAAGNAASGQGRVYLPLLNEMVDVKFEGIAVNVLGGLFEGEVKMAADEAPQLTGSYDEKALERYMELAKDYHRLPVALNSLLEARGLQFGNYDMFLTDLTLTNTGARAAAMLLAQNADGRMITFSQRDIEVEDGNLNLCHQQFALDGGDQPSGEYQLPILFKAHDPNVTSNPPNGTYVIFKCTGLEEFQIEGEYIFPKDQLIPADPAKTEVVATFSVRTKKWGQFLVRATIDSFLVAGVDEVKFNIQNAYIDFADNLAPPNFPADYSQNDSLPVDETWKGFFLQEASMTLPEAVNNCKIGIYNFIYDKAKGVTGVIAAQPNLKVDIEGWKLSLDSVLIGVKFNSLDTFNVRGFLRIPVLAEADKLGYEAIFSRNPTNKKLEPSFNIRLGGVYAIPFLDGSSLTLEESSKAGFRYEGGKFQPFCDLNGKFSIHIHKDGFPEFDFPDLTFEGFKLGDLSIPKPPSLPNMPSGSITGGFDRMSFSAFKFSGIRFPAIDMPPPAGAPAQQDTMVTGANEKLSGFPISIGNIKFRSVEENGESLKKISFDLKVNFTSATSGGGIAATAGLGVIGKLKFDKLISDTPWKALEFKELQLDKILIDADLGGVKIKGGVAVIRNDPTYGHGYKGALELTVEPAITVQAVAQFGEINSLRYWFVDAKMLLRAGIPIVPGVVGIYGFGGGAYYNMVQSNIPSKESLKIVDGTDAGTAPPNSTEALLAPGVSLSGAMYTPQGGGVVGVKATVVLGTHPDASTANMDLTLEAAFNTSPFGLKYIELRGDAYFMAPITQREDAKVTASMNIRYDFENKLLTGNLTTSIKLDPILTGGGSCSMRFNMKEGQSDDWYIAIGAPPISKRMNLNFKVNGTNLGRFEAYFVAGNFNSLPSDMKIIPKLREYHPALQQFESSAAGLDLSSIQGGMAVLMGSRFTLGPIKKEWMMFKGEASATVGFDALISRKLCQGYTEIGIKGWYLEGQIYGAFSGSVDIYVDLLFDEGWFNIFDIRAQALIEAKLPNPSWMQAQLSGTYSILGGIVEGDFNFKAEMGTKCEPMIDAGVYRDLVTNVKIISDIKPNTGENNIPVYAKKLLAVSFSKPINQEIDFSRTANIKFKPTITFKTVKAKGSGIPVNGVFTYLNKDKVSVSEDDNYIYLEFKPTALLTQKTDFVAEVGIKWFEKEGTGNWKPVLKNGVEVIEQKQIEFKTGVRPDELIKDVVLFSAPGFRGRYYYPTSIPRILVDQPGWGFLFNPKRKVNGVEYEYNYYLRLTEAGTNRIYQEPLIAVPTPEYNQISGDKKPIYANYESSNNTGGFFGWFENVMVDVANTLGIKKITGWQPDGPTAVQQPDKSATISNVKNMPNSLDVGGGEPVEETREKVIGLPNFNSFVRSAKIYKLEIVGIAIVPDKSLEVGLQADTSTQTAVTSSSNYTYTVRQTSQTIQNFSAGGGAPEKVLYEFSFRTSYYQSLAEKLSAGESSLVQLEKGGSIKKEELPGYPINMMNNELTATIEKRKNVMFYQYGGGNLEGFDKYDFEDLKKHTKYKRGQGYIKQLEDDFYQNDSYIGIYHKVLENSYRFDYSDSIGAVFDLELSGSEGLLTDAEITNGYGSNSTLKINVRLKPYKLVMFQKALMTRSELFDYFYYFNYHSTIEWLNGHFSFAFVHPAIYFFPQEKYYNRANNNTYTQYIEYLDNYGRSSELKFYPDIRNTDDGY